MRTVRLGGDGTAPLPRPSCLTSAVPTIYSPCPVRYNHRARTVLHRAPSTTNTLGLLHPVCPAAWLFSRGNTVFGGKLPRTRLFWIVAGALVVTFSIVAFYLLRPSAQPARAAAAFSEF